MDVFNEFLIELVAFHCFRFAQYHQLHAGTGDGYVHSSQVIQETYLSVFIGTDQAEDAGAVPGALRYGPSRA